ncbi:hypothetical protein BgAZ_402880 [Babesia gibsoni]|uniref:DUF676 domain-containing protein n=1 Tax=Babesia gibsoni TaxID=33632 RepID=A0AAD8LIW6_BABGI|nr:hypothetical protein BgAZ_402880 [Babesia gibsoni]
MAEPPTEDKVTGLCYHCRVRTTDQICFADDTSFFYDAKAVDSAKAYWQVVSDRVIREKNRAQSLATIVSSKVLELMTFVGNTFVDMPMDLNATRDVRLEMFSMPDSVKMCDGCHCFFSRNPPCHCVACMGENYRSHYVILMHGVLAEPFMMSYVASFLLKSYPHVFIYFPHNIAGKSLVGLELVLDMFSSEILALFEKVPDMIKLSLIGHSFGGIILRYWMMFYYRNMRGIYHTSQKPASDWDSDGLTATSRHLMSGRHIDIEWCNYISLASPHAGIYENHAAFRKLVSFMGSLSVDQLDNESVDLLVLLSKDGRDSMLQFANIVVYGNLSGDMLVAPRTSILLPYHKVDSNRIRYFTKIAEEFPGVPQHVCELMLKFDRKDDVTPSSASSDSDHQPEQCRDDRFQKIRSIFYSITAEKIRCSSHIIKLLHGADAELADASEMDLIKQVFTKEDIDYFDSLLSQIVDRSPIKLMRKFSKHPKLLYSEVLLSGLWGITQHKFAVYLPTICMPHNSIVTVGDLGPWEGYTRNILSHVSYMFVA